MNSHIDNLYRIASGSERKIIGLMSGTSLDGLDIALCHFRGSGLGTSASILEFETIPYTEKWKAKIKSVFARRDADLQAVCLLNESLGTLHGEMILSALAGWGIAPAEIDLIASHGQTIFHSPKILHGLADQPNGTLQIGDGDHIAVKTGIITMCDFRQKHLAAGGEGAPLAVYGDYLIFSKKGENRIMLNIGGIANFTYLPADQDAFNVFSTDAGPGNTLMDQYIRFVAGLDYDRNAEMASMGKPSESLLEALLDDPFFLGDFPKTTGPELFNLQYLKQKMAGSDTMNLPPEDILATLCLYSAKGISMAIGKCPVPLNDLNVYLSGGGMHNPLLRKHLQAELPDARFFDTSDLGINPDAKEALLFALLANEAIAGEPVNFGNREGTPSVCMGKICMP